MLTYLPPGALPDQEDRGPPPAATPLDFPHWESSQYAPYAEGAAKQLYSLFSSIQKPADVSTSHVNALNLRVHYDQTLENLVPPPRHGEAAFLPDGQNSNSEGGASKMRDTHPTTPATLCNGREAPALDVYEARSAELKTENEDVFRLVQRLKPRAGKKPMRPGHFYKFWQGLYLMASYWDTSQDEEYEEVSPSVEDISGEEAETPTTTRRYKGRRKGTGREMPDQFREDAVRAFVETAAWLFGCQVSVPRLAPRITLQSSLFAVRLNYSVFRISTDRQRARQGLVEGPVMGMQCRSETQFRAPDQEPGTGRGEALDILREVAAMLLLAQERAREGRTLVKPGEGKWYTCKPRWGGGPGGEVGNVAGGISDDPNSTASKNAATAAAAGEGKPKATITQTSRARSRKQSAADAYKKLQPGAGTWDPHVTYEAIGKQRDSSFDYIFLVSSINHHIAILRLKVHRAYIIFLETGELPPSDLRQHQQAQPQHHQHQQQPMPFHSSRYSPEDGTGKGKAREGEGEGQEGPWDVIELHRSKWFDLFDADDRVEAFRGMWGVMAWLMRSDQPRVKEHRGNDGVGRVLGAGPGGPAGGGNGSSSGASTLAALDEDVIMSD
ncbi:MAG: Ras GTPase ras2 [Watsoniomyces obsoletus]|nr:MAG: Ras GTPase ras2 [Watsoniomyces obsoletus]